MIHIVKELVKIKKYLRKLPSIIEEEFEDLTIEEIIHFDPFNNIFRIDVLNGGSGYIKSPELIISPPDIKGSTGFQLEGIPEVGPDGDIIQVHTSMGGSGYSKPPNISVAKPEDPNGNVATVVASRPENDILTLE